MCEKHALAFKRGTLRWQTAAKRAERAERQKRRERTKVAIDDIVRSAEESVDMSQTMGISKR